MSAHDLPRNDGRSVRDSNRQRFSSDYGVSAAGAERPGGHPLNPRPPAARRFPRIPILIALVFVGASSLLRYKGETYVEAVAAAKAAAAGQFDLDEVRRNKIIVQELV
jgi:hypothetical protein